MSQKLFRLTLEKKEVFAGDLSIPPFGATMYKDVPLVYEWDPNLTKINSVTMSWAAQTSGWLAGTGQVTARVLINSKIADDHTFYTPGTYSNVIDITSLFFNGPNVFRPIFIWQYLPPLSWISNQIRIDITIDYTGLPPNAPKSIEEYAPYVALGVGSGIVIYLLYLWSKRGR